MRQVSFHHFYQFVGGLEIMYYFCNNKSRPLPVRLAYPAGHFLFMGVRYTNQAITTEQQIDILKERGLLIDNVEQAIEVFDSISYFRLAGYWRHLEIDRTTHLFTEDF